MPKVAATGAPVENRNKKRYNGFFKFCAYAFAVLFSLGGYVTTEYAVNGLKGSSKIPMILLAIASWGCVVSCLVFILIGAGEKKKDRSIHLAHADYLFTEFWLFITAAALGGLFAIYYYPVQALRMGGEAGSTAQKVWALVLTYLLVEAAAVVLVLCYGGVVRRFKAGVFYQHSFIHAIVNSVTAMPFYRRMKGTVRMAALIAVYAVFMVVMILIGRKAETTGLVLSIIVSILFLCGFCSLAAELEVLRKGSNELASGNLQYKVKARSALPATYEIAQNLNRMSEGMQHAIDEQIKSERMKSELITNVSHDIKTPLTSIINYVDLLKKEGIEQGAAKEYLDILDQKSMRLKSLTEDLVEASKASTGNLTVELNRIDAKELLNQAVGEFKERFEASDLEVIVNLPREELTVLADGRHMWRVIENMLSNACKYAMKHTRVYVDLYAEGALAGVAVKNISGQQLNITEDELLQRFVRGDSSRNTEGSGLGLSIAKSLAELQGGSFQIRIDGDLFKAVAQFKMAEN